MLFPPVLMRLMRRIAQDAIHMSWPYAIGMAVLHASSVAAVYAMLGEFELISGVVQFIYFYVVTGSSVGYGDFSPGTDAGKLFTALWVIPGAISIFAFLVGKIIATISSKARRKMNGYGNYSTKTGHIVILGHVRGQTERLLEETARLHGTRDIIIVATEDLSGQQSGWDFVRATNLSNTSDLERSGVAGAEYVVVLGASDEESMAASLAVASMGLSGHCVAYFRDAGPARLVTAHCPNIEVVTSTSVEQVARALSDPGAGEVLRRLVNTDVGATLNSIEMRGASNIRVADLMIKMLSNHSATLIGYRPCAASAPVLSLSPDMMIEEGQIVYYVANKRLEDDATIAA